MKLSIFTASLVCAGVLFSFNVNAEGFAGTATQSGRPVEQRLGTPSSSLMPTQTIFLYPDGQAAAVTTQSATRHAKVRKTSALMTFNSIESNGLTGAEVPEKGAMIANVGDSARIDIYLPSKSNGQMLVVLPGGGYHNLSSWNEGIYVAKWLTERGIAACVVKYRLPNGHSEIPLQDAQNAFRYCRANARHWGIDQIGVIGFSAGGHLASTVETKYVDAVTKPDFAVLIYPVISMDNAITHAGSHRNLLGTGNKAFSRDSLDFDNWQKCQDQEERKIDLWSSQNNVTSSTPETYIALSTDDNIVPPINSILFYNALLKNKVSAEMHIFPRGGHGWGFTTTELGKDRLDYSRDEFFSSLERWLKDQHAKVAGGKTDSQAPAKAVATKTMTIRPFKTVLLYPYGQNVDKGLSEAQGPCESNEVTGPEVCAGSTEHLSNVGDSARFTLYIPEHPNGQMAVVCPGGSYLFTSQVNEGKYVAQWLADRGISTCLMQYRLPCGHWTVPLTDVQNAFMYCRSHAAEWGIKQIGIMGFSAGGHLAASASTMYTDSLTRPDFSVLIYPFISLEEGQFPHNKVTHDCVEALIGKNAYWYDREDCSYVEYIAKMALRDELVKEYSQQNNVTATTPVTFIALSNDDPSVPPENSLEYYKALLANKVPCEMHIYQKGGHGWGFRTPAFNTGTDKMEDCRDDFFMSLDRFLKECAASMK